MGKGRGESYTSNKTHMDEYYLRICFIYRKYSYGREFDFYSTFEENYVQMEKLLKSRERGIVCSPDILLKRFGIDVFCYWEERGLGKGASPKKENSPKQEKETWTLNGIIRQRLGM